MENKNSKMYSSEDLITAIKEDEVLMSVIEILYNTTVKIKNIINNYEGRITDYEGDNACINISVDNFTDIEPFYISCFKSDIIDYCNYHKPRYELIDIDLIDDIVILKVKV
jgi:hypothetical protein